MTKAYCLTVEVESKHIENGLGYLVAFALPDDKFEPAQMTEYPEWAEKVKQAVLRAGDQVYNPDPYTKKLAIAELMNEFEELNAAYSIQITGSPDLPALQIQSTNPYDSRLEIDFTGKEGEFTVVEKGLSDLERRTISSHGKTGLVDGARRHFPFTQNPPSIATKPHKPKPPQLRP